MDNYKIEVWKSVTDFEGLYEVSNWGRLRSLDKYVESPFNGGCLVLRKGKIMNPPIVRGYCQYAFSKNKIRKCLKIHRMVAIAFIPNPNNYPQVNHINGIKTDNRIENLEWVTPSENQKHAIRIGLKVMHTDDKSHNHKLTKSEVIEILKFRLSIKARVLASQYHVTKGTIENIRMGKCWPNLHREYRLNANPKW